MTYENVVDVALFKNQIISKIIFHLNISTNTNTNISFYYLLGVFD